MKKVAVVLLVVSTMLLAGVAQAAKPKRSRNSNRVGPYGAAIIGMSSFGTAHTTDEADLIDSLQNSGFPSRNVTASTEDSDLGYQAVFGYRFNRYVAFELGLAQFGKVKTTAKGDLDFGEGYLPTSLTLSFSVGGPLFSAVGILPVNDKLEFFGRAGLLLASSNKEIESRIDGEDAGSGGSKGDSTNVVFGGGATWHFNQVYSARLEYLHLGEVGQTGHTGKEELSTISVGVLIRF